MIDVKRDESSIEVTNGAGTRVPICRLHIHFTLYGGNALQRYSIKSLDIFKYISSYVRKISIANKTANFFRVKVVVSRKYY